MMYKFDVKYDKITKTTYKILLDDGSSQKIILLDIYAVKDNWYINVRDEQKNLHTGQKINSYEDLFEICKRRYRDFPNVKLIALPINLNGFDVSFNIETAGILQDLVVVTNE